MPIPQTSSRLLSLLSNNLHSTHPVCDWINNTNNEKDILDLLIGVQGIPHGWLNWTDKQIRLSLNREICVKNLAKYALSTLWSGITLLQECKFLCDVLENAFRSSFINYILLNRITYEQIYPLKYRNKIKNISKLFPKDESSIISSDFITETGFEQLVRTISLNWKSIRLGNDKRIWGFRRLFWNEFNCRDVNLFTNDMGNIRNIRNIRNILKDFFVKKKFSVYKNCPVNG